MLKRLLLAFALLFAADSALHAQSATAPGHTFAVRVAGKGRPMILIPGLTCGGDVWNTTVAHFQERYECHILTLPGFAGQPPVAAPMMDAVRKDIVAYIREKHLDHPVVVGHSLGGFLAFWIASSEPDLVGPIAAVDGLPFLSALMNPAATAESSKPMAESMKAMMGGQSPEMFASQNKMFLAGMITNPKDVDAIAPSCARSDPKSVGQAMAELMTTDLRGEVAKIKVPALLIGAGGNYPSADMLASGKKSYEAQIASIPNHRLAFSEKSKHFIMFDDPAFLFSTLDSFLAQSAPAR